MCIRDRLGTDHGPAHDVIEFGGKKTVVFAINAMPTASITQEIQNYKHDPDGNVQEQLDMIHTAQLRYTEKLYNILNQKLRILVNEENGEVQDFDFYSMTAKDISSFLKKFSVVVKSTTTSPKANLVEAIKDFVISSEFNSFISMVSDAKILRPGEPNNTDPKNPTKLDYIGRKADLTDVQISELADLVISKSKEMAVLITGILKGSRKVSLEPLEGFEPKLNGKDDPTSEYANQLQIAKFYSYVSETVRAEDKKANSSLDFIAFVIEGGGEVHPESFLPEINGSLSSIHPDHYEELSSVTLGVLGVNGEIFDITNCHA